MKSKGDLGIMKKVWKWIICIVIVLCIAILDIIINVYGDVKSTAKEIYTPINNIIPVSPIRLEPVDITFKKEPFSALILGVDERENIRGRSDTSINENA